MQVSQHGYHLPFGKHIIATARHQQRHTDKHNAQELLQIFELTADTSQPFHRLTTHIRLPFTCLQFVADSFDARNLHLVTDEANTFDERYIFGSIVAVAMTILTRIELLKLLLPIP